MKTKEYWIHAYWSGYFPPETGDHEVQQDFGRMVEAIQADAIAATKAEYQVLTCSQFQWDAMTKRLEHLEQESKSKDAEIAGYKEALKVNLNAQLAHDLIQQNQLLLAQVAVMSEAFERACQCLGFFKSVINCGEQWSQTCEQSFAKATTRSSLPAEAQQLLEEHERMRKALELFIELYPNSPHIVQAVKQALQLPTTTKE